MQLSSLIFMSLYSLFTGLDMFCNGWNTIGYDLFIYYKGYLSSNGLELAVYLHLIKVNNKTAHRIEKLKLFFSFLCARFLSLSFLILNFFLEGDLY